MSGNFQFATNLKSEIYCLIIAQEMVDIFSISEKEAIQRVSFFWKDNEFIDEDDMIFIESPEYWAKSIYYEEVDWWNKNERELTPRKYS